MDSNPTFTPFVRHESTKTINANSNNGEIHINGAYIFLKISAVTIAATMQKIFPNKKSDGKVCISFKEFLCLSFRLIRAQPELNI